MMATKAPQFGARAARGEEILSATLEQLACVGYRALSIEEVADKAGVNKTTIYRRWPTKRELVQAALASCVREATVVTDTGTLRGDLLAVGRGYVAFASSIVGQGLFRVVAMENAEPELEGICRTVRAEKEALFVAIVERATARGEIKKTIDPRLLHQMLIGPLHLKLFFHNERADDVFIRRAVDLLLSGVAPTEQKAVARPRRRRSAA